MAQPPFATGQPLRDLPQRLGLGELAEAHRHELIPATEALAAFFGSGAGHGRVEFAAINQI
jgi:hypothetical protein